MWMMLFFLSGIISTIIFIFSDIHVEVKSIHRRTKTFYRVKISAMGLPLLKGVFTYRMLGGFDFEIIRVRHNSFKTMFSFKKVLNRERKKGPLSGLIERVLKSLKIKKLTAYIMLGTGDAAITAMLCGGIITAVNIALPIVKDTIKDADIEIKPDFEKRTFDIFFRCIIGLKPADIIKKYLINKGGGVNASNRKHFADNNV